MNVAKEKKYYLVFPAENLDNRSNNVVIHWEFINWILDSQSFNILI